MSNPKNVDDILAEVIDKLARVVKEIRSTLTSGELSKKIDFSGGDDTWFDYRPDGIYTIIYLAKAIEFLASGEGQPIDDFDENLKNWGLGFQDLVSIRAQQQLLWLLGLANDREAINPEDNNEEEIPAPFAAGQNMRNQLQLKNILDIWNEVYPKSNTKHCSNPSELITE